MILLPGVLSRRDERRSLLSFAWYARDASLRALTGQQGALAQLAPVGTTVGGAILPAYGAALSAGKAQPRFSRVGAENVLALSGGTAGIDQERLSFPYAQFVQDLTVLIRLRGGWALGASLAAAGYVFALGSGASEGGRIGLVRNAGALWTVQRWTPASNAQASLTETAALTWPVDVLIRFTHATEQATLHLRGANGTVLGPAIADSSGSSTGRFLGDVLTLGSDPIQTPGATIDLYWCKIALGLYEYAGMDALA